MTRRNLQEAVMVISVAFRNLQEAIKIAMTACRNLRETFGINFNLLLPLYRGGWF